MKDWMRCASVFGDPGLQFALYKECFVRLRDVAHTSILR